MKDRDTPLRLVRKMEKVYRNPYEFMDSCAKAKPDSQINWPDYCPLPIAAAGTYIMELTGGQIKPGPIAAELIACWSWRKCPVIYRFDADLAASLAEQAEGMEDWDILPTEILVHLPYPCIYVKTPIYGDEVDGFFSWIEYDLEREAPELRVQLVMSNFEHSLPLMLHLTGGTIRECIQDTVEETNRHRDIKVDSETVGASDILPILRAVQHLLYLAAQNADIEDAPPPAIDRAKRKITPGKPKAGDIAEKQVGVRVGAALRKTVYHKPPANAEPGSGTAKRPHTRRGHWHHYWTGPRGAERTLILKWTAPTVIHPDAAGSDTVVIFPVKQ